MDSVKFKTQKCRFCSGPLDHEFIDLINAPPSNSFLKREQLDGPETYYPLKVLVCASCFLVQVDEYKSANEIFDSEYIYFSSFSKSWLEHCRQYAARMTERFHLGPQSKVMEVASNDGYLLQFFKEKNISVLGIEPTRSTAEVAIQKGIETTIQFFGLKTAQEIAAKKGKADLIAANNVLAHVPDINDFVSGFSALVADNGVVTVEFPHVLQLVSLNQFDTIYHEHFSYLSFFTVKKIFESHGLNVFDVDELPTHGGSLRVYADKATHPVTSAVSALLEKEKSCGIDQIQFYENFQNAADTVKHEFLSFLLEAKKLGKSVAAYGAAAKGNTLLNYCGVKKDLISFVVDLSPHKQGRFLPGSHLEVFSEDAIRSAKPDYIIIFPWNLKNEIVTQLSYIREWGGKFVVAIPELTIW